MSVIRQIILQNPFPKDYNFLQQYTFTNIWDFAKCSKMFKIYCDVYNQGNLSEKLEIGKKNRHFLSFWNDFEGGREEECWLATLLPGAAAAAARALNFRRRGGGGEPPAGGKATLPLSRKEPTTLS